jgi:hypothetical protein
MPESPTTAGAMGVAAPPSTERNQEWGAIIANNLFSASLPICR